jgi:hypothetical protein
VAEVQCLITIGTGYRFDHVSTSAKPKVAELIGLFTPFDNVLIFYFREVTSGGSKMSYQFDTSKAVYFR